MNIGLTGGIATGKSTVANLLVKRGAILIDLDLIAREVVEPGQPALARIAEWFGQAVLREDGTLDRKKLGSIVFADEAQRKALEAILHPEIRSVMKERMAKHESLSPNKLVVVDVPLLFESKLESYFEQIMLVYVPREEQFKRLMKRDGLAPEEAQRRLAAQMSIEDKKAHADIIIDNSGGIDRTEEQIIRWLRDRGLG